MGNLRSKDGCLTCRTRHVKCDEILPVCGQCKKRDRYCQRDDSIGIQIRTYRPHRHRKASGNRHFHDSSQPRIHEFDQILDFVDIDDSHVTDIISDGGATAGSECSLLHATHSSIAASNGSPLDVQIISHSISPPIDPSPPFYIGTSIPISHLLQQSSCSPLGENESRGLVPNSPTVDISAEPDHGMLSFHEAYMVYHYATHLGRWLDCTDASRQFTLKIPELVKTSPVLLHAVMSFAARHMGDTAAADQAHERCVKLMIPLLDSDNVVNDDVLLCAIVILRVFEQMNVMVTGSDQGRHLAGCSALLRASQGPRVDPSIPGLRQAAFWVYMRQCLYNACVNQQPPNVDLSLVLCPVPLGGDQVGDLRSETAWANRMTWICASVIQLCFGSGFQEPRERMQKWNELTNDVESWVKDRPRTFDPLWCSAAVGGSGNPFPQFWFTADWHVVAFGFYHLACMLLIIYKPSAKFAVRVVRASPRELDIMEHARAICGACQGAPLVVPSLITLCHTVFIWGPLMTEDAERDGVVQLLRDMEREHSWPTTWIVTALQEEWALG